MSFERVNLILREIGLKESIENLTLDEAGHCALRLHDPDAPPVHLQYVATENALVLFAELGFPPADREAELLRGFLEDNLFWAGAKGAVFALNPGTGRLVLQRRDPADDLTSELLQIALESFVECALDARRKLFEDGEPQASADDSDPNAIRV